MPPTEEQRNALREVHVMFNAALSPSGITKSVEERAQQPDPAQLPADLTVHIDIAPPSLVPHPLLLKAAALRTPERVPVYFYGLQTDQTDVGVADTRVIFHIHGGANIIGHPTETPFVQFFAQLLRAVALHSGGATKWVLIAPSYRLANVPENAFPAGLQDIVAAYDYVLDQGYTPSNIVIAGDSAGGNHAVVLTHLILQSERLPPRGVVSIAPFAILPPTQPSEAQASWDIIDPSKDELLVSTYLGDSGIVPSDPLISGAFVPISALWPKTLILVGTADHILEGSRELAKRLADSERPVELVEYDDRPHAWWVLPHIFPEDIKDTAERIARFVINEHES